MTSQTISQSDLAEHFKMLIDNDRGSYDYFYNLAAECKAEDDMSKLRDHIEQYLNDLIDERVQNDDNYMIRDMIGKIFHSSDFVYNLTKMIWEDEATDDILSDF